MVTLRQTLILDGIEDINNMEFRQHGKYLRASAGIVKRSWTAETIPAVEAEIVPDKRGSYFFRYRINRYDSDWVSSYAHYWTPEETITDCKEAIKDEWEDIINER